MNKNNISKEQFEIMESFEKPWRRGWEHISEEEQLKLREKNKELHNKRRFECEGTKEDKSDRCDLYDSEGYCRYYGDTWKDEDGIFRGGMDVELITYCTRRTIKGKCINDSINPLYMERLPRWMEFLNEKGEFESCHGGFWNEDGRNPP